MKPEIDTNKVVVFTGAGISAESGLQTFRDSNGLWNDFKVEDVATPEAWASDQELVLQFYNDRRKQAFDAIPNEAHDAVARLEEKFEVIVITQNIDDLHERSGSTNVIHVHGQLKYARSSKNDSLLYLYDEGKPIQAGDVCDEGSQLRPDVVWFGEDVQNYDLAIKHILTAGRVLVVGTSLSVHPAAGILKKARFNAEKIITTKQIDRRPPGYKLLRGTATKVVPSVISDWLNERKVI
jgi:NAD-dependent deacetylase